METSDVEKTYPAPEESGPLHRNRSFKSKQLVRSQAIRESASPPRTVSPLPPVKNNAQHVNNRSNSQHVNVITNSANVNNRSDSQHVNVITNNNKENVITVNNSNGKSVKERTISEVESDTSSQVSRVECSDSVSASNSVSDDVRKQPVEIQITQGWDTDPEPAHGARPSPHTQLLSNHPRVACVCGADSRDCRGRRRKYTQKQDSGISDECPDCSDNELSGDTNDNTLRKSSSLDLEEDQSYCRCSDKKETPKNIPFTRADSDERAELHGQELINFIRTTLSRNPRDRTTLLRIERELRQLINDTSRCVVRFPVMTSYGRMLVHRCAALFQLQHRIDPHNKACVIVSKSGGKSIMDTWEVKTPGSAGLLPAKNPLPIFGRCLDYQTKPDLRIFGRCLDCQTKPDLRIFGRCLDYQTKPDLRSFGRCLDYQTKPDLGIFGRCLDCQTKPDLRSFGRCLDYQTKPDLGIFGRCLDCQTKPDLRSFGRCLDYQTKPDLGIFGRCLDCQTKPDLRSFGRCLDYQTKPDLGIFGRCLDCQTKPDLRSFGRCLDYQTKPDLGIFGRCLDYQTKPDLRSFGRCLDYQTKPDLGIFGRSDGEGFYSSEEELPRRRPVKPAALSAAPSTSTAPAPTPSGSRKRKTKASESASESRAA
ncbi:unnamed protein product [Plutella xylostella]|uniref:(diamondback moth) hypothetical protein n=1 Tax=Plutella xylostella TaxID=51655 RepID=A0A8S4G1X9_PLUXY|nr:unnamed protein product [Plutella xylostella]